MTIFYRPQFEDKTQSPFKAEETVYYWVLDQSKIYRHIKVEGKFHSRLEA